MDKSYLAEADAEKMAGKTVTATGFWKDGVMFVFSDGLIAKMRAGEYGITFTRSNDGRQGCRNRFTFAGPLPATGKAVGAEYIEAGCQPRRYRVTYRCQSNAHTVDEREALVVAYDASDAIIQAKLTADRKGRESVRILDVRPANVREEMEE